MKISSEELSSLKSAIQPHDTEQRREVYLSGDFPRPEGVKDLDTRYRWDLFYAVKGWSHFPEDSSYSTTHIDTALRQIVPPFQKN